MASASWQFDEGQSFPTKCFPTGTLQRGRKEGAGHWLMAYRETEEQTNRATHRRVKENFSQEVKKADPPCGFTLDRQFLLQLHCVDEPAQLCSVNVSEQKLKTVKPEDLREFENVASIDASINSLCLGSFSCFASLRELILSLNRICNMTFEASDFPHLQVLDLSYNSLSGKDIISLSRLPQLKVLHLTGNQLHHLPPDLGSLSYDHTQLPAADRDGGFEALEVLMLDENKLSSGVFYSLRNLKRVKHLNLQGNRISEIPYLTTYSKSVEISDKEEKDPHTEEHLKTIETFPTDRLEEECNGAGAPLPELQLLNLANNKIATEEALVTAALFPKLREIDIHSNPLTTQRSGDPPFLTFYLHERLGIEIKRKQAPEVQKPPLKVSTHSKWKVEEKIPKVSKRPLSVSTACPTQTQTDKCETDVKITPRFEGRSGSIVPETREHFFMTEADHEPQSECEPSSGEREAADNRHKCRTGPEQSSCSEVMMDAKAIPDVLKSLEIQTAVRMLEHTVRNLHIYRESKPNLDSIQTL
ncbi:X-ray radiation resistance-associated protein 1 [Menidia menidia]